MECSKNAARLKAVRGKGLCLRVYGRTQPRIDQVRVQIVEKKELLIADNEVISIVTAEKSRRKVMLKSYSNDSLALIFKSLKWC